MKKTTNVIAPNITVQKSASCPSLSGKGKLDYKLGTDPTGIPHLCLTGNTGGGHYSAEWVAWPAIEAALKKVTPVTSLPLRTLFRGQSANNPGYLLAVLLQEQLVARLPDKTKQYALTGNQPAVSTKKTTAKAPAKAPARKTASAKK